MPYSITVSDQQFLRVEEAAARLLRIAALKRGTMRALAGWLPRMPDFDSKCHLSRHLYQDARGSHAVGQRVWELEFGRGAFDPPPDLTPFLDLMERAADVEEMLAGLYLTVKAEMVEAYRRYIAETDPVFDAPTLDILTPLVHEEEEQIAWARGELHRRMLSRERKAELAAWQTYLSRQLASLGGVLGADASSADPVVADAASERFDAREPYRLPEAITFTDMPNHSVEADAGTIPDQHRLVYAYYQEIDIVDLLATILYDSPRDMPSAYYLDIARQTWDESRHTTMGIRRLHELGYDLSQCGCPTGRYAAFQRLTVLERLSFLTQVGEACSLAGKREHIKKWLSEGDVASSALVEFDISDESQHVRFGSKWLPELMKRLGETRSRKEMAAHSSLRYRQELLPLKVAAGHTIPDNYLDPFGGCEEVRDPANSF